VPAFFVEGHGERLHGYTVGGGIEYLFTPTVARY
jgi:hypothetical protein